MTGFVCGNYRKLVYLAQTQDVELEIRAEDAVRRLGLNNEFRFCGCGDLRSFLASYPVSSDRNDSFRLFA